jgi:hypothetical protein
MDVVGDSGGRRVVGVGGEDRLLLGGVMRPTLEFELAMEDRSPDTEVLRGSVARPLISPLAVTGLVTGLVTKVEPSMMCWDSGERARAAVGVMSPKSPASDDSSDVANTSSSWLMVSSVGIQDVAGRPWTRVMGGGGAARA